METVNEKELLRKSNHSAIERRRREKISLTLDKLKKSTPISRNQQYIQKLQILENAINYIKYLEEKVGLDYPASPESLASSVLETGFSKAESIYVSGCSTDDNSEHIHQSSKRLNKAAAITNLLN